MFHRTSCALALSIITAGCVGGDDVPIDTYTAGATGVPQITLADTFQSFQPGLFGYGLDRGTASEPEVVPVFGVTLKSVDTAHEITPHDDAPDVKKRVRLTIDGPPPSIPQGSITVHGVVYERIWTNPISTPFFQAVEDTITFSTDGTYTTTEYFDEITSITTAGLNVDVAMTVEWWDGHEQEMSVAVVLSNIADEASCEDDWRVYFNGQTAYPDWDPTRLRCTAGLYAGAIMVGGVLQHSPAYRGLYFGLVYDEDTTDAFHHFVNPTDDPEVAYGHTAWPGTWWTWWADLSAGASLFLPLPETYIRPIAVQLERQSDLHVVDGARMLLRIATDAFGNPGLIAKLGSVENPGAIAQLSPHGLDRLELTHASTLMYPIVPAGTQPRLSERAIELPAHTTDVVTVDLADLPDDDFAYWTAKNPDPNGDEFAGYLAYLAIEAAAKGSHAQFEAAMRTCRLMPPQAQAGCELAAHTSYCVEHNPEPEDFRIRIERIQTYFDPARPEEALAVGGVTNMDLSFGTNQVLADFKLEDVLGWLEASIDPKDVYIEWDTPVGDPCWIKPAARRLSDFMQDGDDHANWLTCHDMVFGAGSGSLGEPVAFDVDPIGEEILTSFAPVLPQVDLASITADRGPDICGDAWLETTMEGAIKGWEAEVEAVIAEELVASPGEDETLDRLLSPYELGIESVDNPPPGTPPYDVHPLPTYSLSAVIGKTTADSRFPGGDATDGLYIPYITRSLPIDAVPYASWFCPVTGGQFCDGLLGVHEPLLEGGLDPDGDPFDVSINYTTAHINQALWAQARRADRLGSPGDPARLDIPTTEVVSMATSLGYTDLTAALAPLGSSFGIRFHQQAAPYTAVIDMSLGLPPRLVYVVPNIVVELVSIDGNGAETVRAKVLVDVVDLDHKLTFSTGGVPALTARWGQRQILSMTSTYLAGCDGAMSGTSCNTHLLAVVGALWWPEVDDKLLDMIEQAPGLHLFDAGQEAPLPRHINNVRTFLQGEGVVLVGDICKPGAVGCP